MDPILYWNEVATKGSLSGCPAPARWKEKPWQVLLERVEHGPRQPNDQHSSWMETLEVGQCARSENRSRR